jgi:hypothetical protein
MDLMLLRIFQAQVALQCRFMMLAATEVNNGLQQHDVHYVFFALQNLLNAAANVSKALWGGGGKLSAERKPLRDSIGIGDDSPLRSVTMRNNFEHFDERLDRWWKDSARHNHFDLMIGPTATSIVGAEDIERFRMFDPSTTDMTFWARNLTFRCL